MRSDHVDLRDQFVDPPPWDGRSMQQTKLVETLWLAAKAIFDRVSVPHVHDMSVKRSRSQRQWMPQYGVHAAIIANHGTNAPGVCQLGMVKLGYMLR